MENEELERLEGQVREFIDRCARIKEKLMTSGE